MKHIAASLLFVLLCLISACSQNGGDEKRESILAGSVISDPPINIEMVYIPAGSFIMGSYNADDEDPPHEVHLSGFYIGKYAITQREWREVMGNNPSQFAGDNLPVESVSWFDAVAFTERLSEMTGQTYRLPTEAEWEYAARAGSTTNFHFGDDSTLLGEYGWYNGNSGETTHPVGLKEPNAWGLYDVVGNVREWCYDWWDPEYYQRSDTLNPVNETKYVYTSPTTNEQFVVRITRSGSYRDGPKGNETAHRHGGNPVTARNIGGFRVARESLP